MRALAALVLYPMLALTAAAWVLSGLLGEPRPELWASLLNCLGVELVLLPRFASLAFATVIGAHAVLGALALAGVRRWWVHAGAAFACVGALTVFVPNRARLALYPGAYAAVVAEQLRAHQPVATFDVARFSAVAPGMRRGAVIAALGAPDYRSDRWFLYRLYELHGAGWMARVDFARDGTVVGRRIEAFD